MNLTRCPRFSSPDLHPPFRPALLHNLSLAVSVAAGSNAAAIEFVDPEPATVHAWRSKITFLQVGVELVSGPVPSKCSP